jgi:hypothetical protein
MRKRFPFISSPAQEGQSVLMPFLPLTLSYGNREVKTYGMLDTGSMVNVIPFSVGLSLGAIWEQQNVAVELGGNFAAYEARGILIHAIIEDFTPVKLAFAWTRADNVPVLFGQTNFFMEFDVLFSRSSLFFEVSPKGMYI